MTKTERENVRQHLLDAGFRKAPYCACSDEPNHYDRAQDGVYTEVWRSDKDRTKITLEWDEKQPDPPKLPKDWTQEQYESAKRVCANQGVPFFPSNWEVHYAEGGYIMNKEPMNGMFIGVEKDGYAHS
jgi:hypothetical protein